MTRIWVRLVSLLIGKRSKTFAGKIMRMTSVIIRYIVAKMFTDMQVCLS